MHNYYISPDHLEAIWSSVLQLRHKLRTDLPSMCGRNMITCLTFSSGSIVLYLFCAPSSIVIIIAKCKVFKTLIIGRLVSLSCKRNPILSKLFFVINNKAHTGKYGDALTVLSVYSIHLLWTRASLAESTLFTKTLYLFTTYQYIL